MKKILFLLVGMLLISCNPEDVPETKGKLDPNAMIVIKPAKGVQLRSTVSGLTALEVVEQTMNMTFRTHYFGNKYSEEVVIADRGFGDNQRDYNLPALMMFGTDIIQTDGSYQRDFIYGTEFYLVNSSLDTIGYIPQTVIDDARIKIELALAEENYTEVYKLFNEAFTFLPISE